MASTSYIEIDRNALNNNVCFLKGLLGSETRISAVVKGNAYGHGLPAILPALEELGIDHFSVYSSAEAREAKKVASPGSTIMVMGFIDPADLAWIITHGVEFYVAAPGFAESVLEVARRLEVAAGIHLELETGMYRTGLTLPQLRRILPLIRENEKYLSVRGITSHFAGAESIANYKRVRKQFTVFNKRVKQLENAGISSPLRHIASSAAAINYPDTRLDLVRTGVLIYGYWPTRETFIKYVNRRKDKSDPLKRAMNWYTSVAHIKKVPAGEFIGYGLNFQANHQMKIMVVPVGYCNGYSRSLSNNGHVIVNGRRSPVIGLVNMNMIICDVTEIPGVKPGDRVILIGRQGEMEITFSSFADMNNSLNYEILARLPENIVRKLI